MEWDAAPAGSVSSAGHSGASGPRPTGTMTRVRGARWTPPGKLLAGTPQARPEVKECRGGAPKGAPPRSKEEAARLASVPGWLATAPGVSQAPAFLGASLPSL